ncbi:hypothetical protein DSCA_27910 [Desulfosarcina alkanivorans]|uniref:Uncharacterized protein n=1 Tax=Desulfosarcina alkanivorans TaxID=571177 RepID=A0A5K7YPM7_9BACT|nr:hypothetical protein [Desulfosarcina alkanivorans]BBO68861.1 hypothetical protein DSCA_27910 [Desulfosarcina alkanivorans]
MIEPIHDHQGDLLARISTCIENGGRLTTEVLAYIETSLFSPTPASLAAFLTDDADCDRDSLLDLIFSPDQDVQADLEPLLEQARFSPEEEAVCLDRLMARAIVAPVGLPDGRPVVRVQVPDFIKAHYLERLNIAWQIDPRVAAAIDGSVSAVPGRSVKVRLRNAGIRWTSCLRTFLARFFERVADSDPDYLACLDLVLSLIGTAGDGDDAYELLAGHKRHLFRSFQQARRFEKLLQRSNMETLMLQGVRSPHASPDELMHQMRLIDRACFQMYGKTETIALPMVEPIRQVSDLDTPEAAVQSLLR